MNALLLASIIALGSIGGPSVSLPAKVAAKYTPDQIAAISLMARVEIARRCAAAGDVLGWGKALFPDKFICEFCKPLHEYFVEIAYDNLTCTEAPRSHAKTTIKCFLIPLFTALEHPDKYLHYLNVQATEDKALDVNRGIKMELEGNEALRALYGNCIGERWTDGQFVLKSGVVFTAIGAGQSIRGLNYRNRRPDYIIVDDLYDEEDIHSPDSTEKKNSWFWGSLYPARATSRQSSVHVQGTAINKNDLMSTMKTNPQVKHRSFKCVLRFATADEPGVVLWPELLTYDQRMQEKDLFLKNGKKSTVIWFREYQNERRDDASSIIKDAFLEGWLYRPSELYARLKKGNDIVLKSVSLCNDPSIGKQPQAGRKAESDMTGTALILETVPVDGNGKGSEFWIEYLGNARRSLLERIEELQMVASRQSSEMRVTRVRIEAISGFDDYASEVIRKTNLPVERVTHVPNKLANLDSKSHYFENRKVHLSETIDPDLRAELIEQLTNNFPTHDDMRDAVLLGMDDTSGIWQW